MTPEEEKELRGHINAIANILYKQTKLEQLNTLSKIEGSTLSGEDAVVWIHK
jgi:hypothetical protein